MKYPFSYTVRGYDYDSQDYYLESGIGFCDGWADAAYQLEQYFGEEFIEITHLELHEETTVLNLSAKAFAAVRECLKGEEIYRESCEDGYETLD
jgi:hypothetical protein